MTNAQARDNQTSGGSALLAELQVLYDRHRYQQAYRRSAQFWQSSTDPKTLTVEELIFAGRLAGQLGGWRLSRWLLRTARTRDPENPYVRYFCIHLPRRHSNLLDELRELETRPDLEANDPSLRAWWYGSQAGVWAGFRDFHRAYQCLERAHSLAPEDGWVWSCESEVLARADRWGDSLAAAERAWSLDHGSPYSHRAMGNSLLHLGRVQEASGLLASAAENTESAATAAYAAWMQTALAEILDGEDRRAALRKAVTFARRADELAPLADREARMQSAAMHLDIAELSDDQEAVENWSTKISSPFHRAMFANLQKHTHGARIRLPFRPAIQKHDACLPTSIATALSAMDIDISADEMAAELTFGGTSQIAAAKWLRQRGLTVRFFAVTPSVATRLIENGIAFVLTTVGESDGHAVAVVGLDEAAGTLMVHDPRSFRTTSYLLDRIGRGEAPLAPVGVAIVPPKLAGLLDELLPYDAPVLEGSVLYHDEAAVKGASTARPIVEDLVRRFPQHPGTRLLRSILELGEGEATRATVELRKLLAEFPSSPMVRRRFIDACRATGNTATMRETLESIVEAGVVPGIQSEHEWIYPPTCYLAEYAEMLASSEETRQRARAILHAAIRRDPSYAPAWNVLANIAWVDRDFDIALLCYRLASCLAESSDGFAYSYCVALVRMHREQEGLDWLEARARKFKNNTPAAGTWTTWISALEASGRPQRALEACAEAVRQQGAGHEVLAFAVPFLARMGRWEESERYLCQLEASGNPKALHGAALQFSRMRGDLSQAISQATAAVRDNPFSMQDRYWLLELIELRDGPHAACEQAAKWVAERPAHEELENAYCELLSRLGPVRRKIYSVLLRRLRRNPEDGWAWRELAFCCISQYGTADEAHRRKLEPRITKVLAECDRIAPCHPATLRASAAWFEARGEWLKAVDAWLVAIERAPEDYFSYRRAWDCSASFSADVRLKIWEKMNAHLQNLPGHLSTARELTMMLAERVGVDEVEATVSEWKASRPDDPEVLEAAADLLLDRGQGRSDAARAVVMLEPAVERFPYHLGLRLSLANAYFKLGRNADAEFVYEEVRRRHPGHPGAHIQLAWIRRNRGRADEALSRLREAKSHNPRNAEVWTSEVRILIAEGRQRDACALVEEGLSYMPENIAWRAGAIDLLLECGEQEKAINAARRGLEVYPRGAYLWFLLGQTLLKTRGLADDGEAESALRRSLSCNVSFYQSADMLAWLLTEQCRFEEATRVLHTVEPYMADPSPARGRMAWIKRMQGVIPECAVHSNYEPMEEAIRNMASVLQQAPWYRFGWSQLMEWLSLDQEWDQVCALLGNIPATLRADVRFREQRLELLEKAGLAADQLDTEWNTLLRDFPEDVSLCLRRIDGLRSSNRVAECADLLRSIHTIQPNNSYIQARLVGILLLERNKQDALKTALLVWFAPQETSNWPADQVLDAIVQTGFGDEFCCAALARLKLGERPTFHAARLLAEHTLKRGDVPKLSKQPMLRRWFPQAAAREVVRLIETIDQFERSDEGCRAELLATLCDYGYYCLVIEYWGKHPERAQHDFGTWAQTGRALLNRKQLKEARELMSGWRDRPAMKMWPIANYVLAYSKSRRHFLEEVAATCSDALSRLPHDHCARFLAHKQAEAYAVLGDHEAFLNTWNMYRRYFGIEPSKEEFFKDRHLLVDIPAMAHTLQQSDVGAYRKLVREVRWRRVTGLPYPDLPWWAILLLLWSVLQVIYSATKGQ